MFGISFFLWFVARGSTSSSRGWLRFQIASESVLLMFLLSLSIAEFVHRRVPVLQGEASDHIVVIGDSISSGLGTNARPWPDVMQQVTRVRVRNLSRAGATVADGLALADGVSPNDHLVLIELGGNDLLEGEAPEAFARGLEALLAKVSAPGRMLVMFELPLLPPQIAYGRIQRRLAAQYGVSLIPKRFLIEVIAGTDATSDGLHLTDEGARRMTFVVVRILSPVLKAQPAPTIPATHL